VQGGEPSSVEGVKVDLHISSRILKAAYRQPINVEELRVAERSSLAVDPGEVVFVITKEILKLPNTMIAVLSPKRTLTHSGIIVLGGFAIDPNYHGALWFGLYNLSSTSFPLSVGKKLIAAMFYELDETEPVEPPLVAEECVLDFPEELVSLIRNYQPVELKGLQEEIQEAKRQIASLRSEISSDRDWKNTFKEGLDRHGHQLEQLIEGLKEERELRRQEDLRIAGKLEGLQGFFGGVRVIWIVVAFVIGSVLTAAVSWGVPKVIDYFQQPKTSVSTNPPAALPPSPALPASPTGK
jgi:dUTPase